MPGRLALVSCVGIPEPDHDEPIVLQALSDAGLDAHVVAWDDPSVDWAGFDVAIVRSTWNYHLHEEAFRTWIERASQQTRLLNPAQVLQENIHKGYLLRLQALGIPVVPTTLLVKGAPLPDALSRGGIVVKPAVSGGSWNTRVFSAGETAMAAFIRESVSLRDTLVQPIVESVYHEGERSIVWIAGELTHKVVKRPRFDDQDESVSEGMPLDTEDEEIAARVMSEVPDGVLYARIDVMRRDGRLELSELELLEPSLFLTQSPSALAAFVLAVQDLF